MNAATARSRPVRRRSVGTKCGFGRQRTSNTRSASTGTPCLKPKLSSVTTSRRARPVARQAHEELPQLVDRHVRRVDDLVGHARGSRSAARARRGSLRSTDRSGASGCGRRVSLKRRTSAAWLASRKISIGFEPRHLAQLLEDLRERRQEVAFAHVDDDRDLLDVAAAAQRQLRQRRNQRRRQVVDAEVAEILERADRLRLARSGQPGEDDERLAAAPRAPSARCRPGVFARRLRGARSRASPRRLPARAPRRPRRRRAPSPLAAASARAARRASRAAWWPRARSSWLRAATSTRIAMLRPGATGMRISGTCSPRIS